MFLVRIEFQRVQAFLFAVPRLRDMVGANVLLGETLRNDLPELAREGAANLASFSFQLPSSDENDPLHETAKTDDKDDPRALFESGILARDGGHFHAVFPGETEAKLFHSKAEQLLLRKLPGLRFRREIAFDACMQDVHLHRWCAPPTESLSNSVSAMGLVGLTSRKMTFACSSRVCPLRHTQSIVHMQLMIPLVSDIRR